MHRSNPVASPHLALLPPQPDFHSWPYIAIVAELAIKHKMLRLSSVHVSATLHARALSETWNTLLYSNRSKTYTLSGKFSSVTFCCADRITKILDSMTKIRCAGFFCHWCSLFIRRPSWWVTSGDCCHAWRHSKQLMTAASRQEEEMTVPCVDFPRSTVESCWGVDQQRLNDSRGIDSPSPPPSWFLGPLCLLFERFSVLIRLKTSLKQQQQH